MSSQRTARLERFRELLATRPVICDGAMGTQLQTLGLAPGECGLRWNIDAPQQVALVHQRYLLAGADLLTTNTFSGTTLALAGYGLDDRARELNRAGAELARVLANDHAFVLGDMGPTGGLLEPYGDVSSEVAADAFRAQAIALLEGGADAILIETMSDPAEASLAVNAARAAGAACVIATFAFQQTPVGLRTMMGTDVETAVQAALEAGAEIVGANCGTELSVAHYTQLAVELVASAEGRPVILRPNAGSPVMEAGQIVYRTGTDAFAEGARQFLAAGVRVIGGCCGTTPAHIAALKGAL